MAGSPIRPIVRPICQPIIRGINTLVGGGASLPAGAAGAWFADTYDATNRAVKNSALSTAIYPHILRAGRRINIAIFYNAASCTLTANAVAGPDGLTEAYTLVSGGNGWFLAPSTLPALGAGTFTLSYEVKRNTTSDQTFKMGFQGSGGTLVTKTATSVWTTVSETQTLSATPANVKIAEDVNGTTPATLQICNIRLTQTASDSGIETLAGHMYLGYNKYAPLPSYASGALDFSAGGYGLIQFPTTSSTNFTVSALVSKVAAGSGSRQSFLSKVQNHTEFSACTEDTSQIKHYLGTQNTTIFGTTNPLLSAGYHVITMRYDGTNLEYWIDDFRIHRQVLTIGATTVADFWSAIYNNGVGYKLAMMAYYTSALTTAQVRQVVSYFQTRAAASGITATSPTRVVYTEGDSISSQTTSWPFVLQPNLSPSAYMGISAIGGATLASMTARGPTLDADLPTLGSRKAILTVLIGANDLQSYPGGTDAIAAASYFTDLQTYCAARRAAGWKVVICTILPRSTPANHNTRRALVNASIISTGVGTYWDKIADFGGDATMGLDANASNVTWYTDGIHPTVAGYAILEALARTQINAL